MPSAGRPFTAELVTRLVAGGVLVAPVTLHTGVSSPERHEPPYPERFRVPRGDGAARQRRPRAGAAAWSPSGRRSCARSRRSRSRTERSRAGEGWTELVVTPERGLWAVDGLLTGLHEPEASHLDLLRAAAGGELLARSYAAALEHGYRWHEFGDSHLILD